MVKKFFKVKNKKIQVCTQCIYDERVPQITFNSKGICNYCDLINKLKIQYGTNTNKGKSSATEKNINPKSIEESILQKIE